MGAYPRSAVILTDGARVPPLLCLTPTIGVLITVLFCFYVKPNISILAQPLFDAFRHIYILYWHNHYPFVGHCSPGLPSNMVRGALDF